MMASGERGLITAGSGTFGDLQIKNSHELMYKQSEARPYTVGVDWGNQFVIETPSDGGTAARDSHLSVRFNCSGDNLNPEEPSFLKSRTPGGIQYKPMQGYKNLSPKRAGKRRKKNKAAAKARRHNQR